MLFERGAATDDGRTSCARQIKSLSILLREEFGVPFRFYGAATGLPMEGASAEGSPIPSTSIETPIAIRLIAEGGPRVRPMAGGRYQLALPFPDAERPTSIAVGAIDGLARTPAEVLQEQTRLGKWLRSVHARLQVASQSAGRHAHGHGHGHGPGHDDASLVGLKVMMSLEHLLRTQRIEKDPDRNRRQVLRSVAAVLQAETLLWVPAEGDEGMLEGEPLVSPWDCGLFARLLLQGPDGARAGYVINNRVQANSWGARFPQVVNLLAVPVPSKGATNWLIALNRTSNPSPSTRPHDPQAPAAAPPLTATGEGSSGPDPAGRAAFRRTDAALLLPFGALLGVQLRASRRHQQFKRLMVGLTRSLAAAADARGTSTVGHSERVARIAVELGRELGLQEDEIGDVYLGGLLHDIGKIGVRDSNLRKRDPLTPGEFAEIRQHVTIGHDLLAEFRPIAHLLPVVRHYRERYDGTGYPDGLKGDSIPFLARVLAVAESYDAMTSIGPEGGDAASAPEHAEEVLKQGADLRWDGRVIAAFFRCRDRIRVLQREGTDDSLREELDAALRHSDRERDGDGDGDTSNPSSHDPDPPRAACRGIASS